MPNGLFAEIAVAKGDSLVVRLQPHAGEAGREAARIFLEKAIHATEHLDATRQEAAIGRLADIILPDDLAAARGALAADNLDLRDRFIAEIPCLTSAEVGARAGHSSSNPYATAARWKKTGDIFAVHHRGTEYFPAFQFRQGRPHRAVKPILAALPKVLSPWQKALWFVSTNGWLDDDAPKDRLKDVETVVDAARREALEVIG